MKVKYTVSIGFLQTVRRGTIVIDENDLEGMTEKEREAYIDEVVWEDACQYVETSWEADE